MIIKDKSLAVEKGHTGIADIYISADTGAWLRVLHKETSMVKRNLLKADPGQRGR